MTRSLTLIFLSYIIVINVSFLSLMTQGALTGFVPDQVPNPMLYPQVCGRMSDIIARSAICDIDRMLSDDEKNLVEGRINLFLEKHERLAEFGVCLIRKISNHYISGANGIEEAAKKFSETVHDKWGIGDSKRHNGILIFLAIEDRIVYISRGSGVQEKLTSPVLDNIIANMKSHLRNQDFGLALEVAVVELEVALTGERATSSLGKGSVSSNSEGWQNLLYIVVILLIITAIIIRNSKDNTSPLSLGRDRLRALANEVSEASECSAGISGSTDERNNHFPSVSCPICLEDFPEFQRQNSLRESSCPEGARDREEGRPQQDTRRAMELRCGHQFCLQCLEQYLQSPEGTKCPICRQPVDAGDPSPSDRLHRPRGGLNESREPSRHHR